MTVKINSQKILDRFDYLQSKTKAQIIPVIKNNANGLGFEKMFRLLSNKTSTFATSYAMEWFKLEPNNKFKISWIWEPNKNLLKIKNLVLCCSNLSQLDFCEKNRLPYALYFNIDMNRGGFENYIQRNPVFLMTHCPYEEKEQIVHWIGNVEKFFDYYKNVPISLANSTVFHLQEKHFNYVRLGRTLFLPSEDYEPVRYTTKLAFIHLLNPGDTVGYCHQYIKKQTKIGILPVGYYHHEKLNFVEVNGELCKVLSQMHDTTVVDITNVKCEVGNEVVTHSLRLQELNFNQCIQRTWKLNSDMVEYKEENCGQRDYCTVRQGLY